MEPFQHREDSGIPYFSLTLWEREFPHLIAGMSARDRESIQHPNQSNYAWTRSGSGNGVIANRRRLVETLGVPLSSWTCGNQVHGTVIREVDADARGRGHQSRDTAFPETDGLLTREEDVLLTSFYADCVPLFFYSPDMDMIGVAHAGWRGTVGGIGPKMVREFVRRGADRKRIRAVIAPSIGACCYEVDAKVADPLCNILPEADRTVLKSVAEGRWKLDLKEANRRLLRGEGLLEEHLSVTHWCTSCHPDLFHSHRRDQGRTGRMVAFIGKRKG
ncbi:peptidoglycan editing factor PgeF [Paludifilum halophilum]|uniref:Purine nucleoside phosphorylase n=1 Tax=Paludifilum halophilum TaxID=1642702 RepID=A0A235B315_9BACL|nr:peptidoglycan editing factor PgeF [Paludifilum halophilum]OYD06632.1 hypothetical protein CHM34_15080 [Paludifilum halophilum]